MNIYKITENWFNNLLGTTITESLEQDFDKFLRLFIADEDLNDDNECIVNPTSQALYNIISDYFYKIYDLLQSIYMMKYNMESKLKYSSNIDITSAKLALTCIDTLINATTPTKPVKVLDLSKNFLSSIKTLNDKVLEQIDTVKNIPVNDVTYHANKSVVTYLVEKISDLTSIIRSTTIYATTQDLDLDPKTSELLPDHYPHVSTTTNFKNLLADKWNVGVILDKDKLLLNGYSFIPYSALHNDTTNSNLSFVYSCMAPKDSLLNNPQKLEAFKQFIEITAKAMPSINSIEYSTLSPINDKRVKPIVHEPIDRFEIGFRGDESDFKRELAKYKNQVKDIKYNLYDLDLDKYGALNNVPNYSSKLNIANKFNYSNINKSFSDYFEPNTILSNAGITQDDFEEAYYLRFFRLAGKVDQRLKNKEMFYEIVKCLKAANDEFLSKKIFHEIENVNTWIGPKAEFEYIDVPGRFVLNKYGYTSPHGGIALNSLIRSARKLNFKTLALDLTNIRDWIATNTKVNEYEQRINVEPIKITSDEDKIVTTSGNIVRGLVNIKDCIVGLVLPKTYEDAFITIGKLRKLDRKLYKNKQDFDLATEKVNKMQELMQLRDAIIDKFGEEGFYNIYENSILYDDIINSKYNTPNTNDFIDDNEDPDTSN